MDKQRDDYQTKRMELHVYLEKERQIVADYQEGIKHFPSKTRCMRSGDSTKG